MQNDRKVAIELKDVSKVYMLHHEKPTLTEQVFSRKRNERFEALKNVNLTIFQGEKVGIIGANGAGKTTMLKIIAGITTPTTGKVITHGKIVSLIDLEAGFHPDLTGEENIYLNGLIIGMSKQEITQKFSEIIDFADIGYFIDSPLYTYSAGMKLRLGFAIAVHANPDILILDENIMVGDQDFQEKSSRRIQDFFQQNKTMLIVSHWPEYLKRHCQKIIWIKHDKKVIKGGIRLLNEYN